MATHKVRMSDLEEPVIRGKIVVDKDTPVNALQASGKGPRVVGRRFGTHQPAVRYVRLLPHAFFAGTSPLPRLLYAPFLILETGCTTR
jgi:hypothetical protein